MKKAFLWLIFSICIIPFIYISAEAANNYNTIQVKLYDKALDTYSTSTVSTVNIMLSDECLKTDVPAFIVNDRTLVPIRSVAELFGAEVSWNETTQQAFIKTDEKNIILTIDSENAQINGKNVKVYDNVSVKLASYKGVCRTMVPFRFIAEAFGAEVSFNPDTYTVTIEKRPQNKITSIYSDSALNSVNIETNYKPKYNISKLDGRVVVDILGASLESESYGEFDVNNGFISSVRYSQYNKGYEGYSEVVRVVLDVLPEVSYPENFSITTKDNGIFIYNVGSTDAPEEPVKGKILVAIDPGHGGSDPGAVCGDLKEKDLNLDVALKVRDILQNSGIDVLMTRTTDDYVSLSDRAKLANSNNADIFVSIHTNTSTTITTANGIETYSWDTNCNGEVLAKCIQGCVIEQTEAVNRGTKTANFFVLRETNMSAVLIEMGFISNKIESDLLCDESYRQKIAEGIAKGILEYYSDK